MQLIVYTAPAALDGLRPRIDRLAAALNLTLDVEAAVRDDDDWRDSWKQFYAPIILGGGALLLRPSWIPRRPDDPEREIVLDPGRAFGTGQHESTRLCLDLACGLEGRSPAQVLDLGCGSGILAIAAARLFPTAERIVAGLPHSVDVDVLMSAGLFGLIDAIKSFDLRRKVKAAFDEAGVEIPFPRTVVYHRAENDDDAAAEAAE